MAHTPAPWTMDGHLLVGPAGSIAKVFDPQYAPLLTSAPDLLAALTDAQEIICGEFCSGGLHKALCTKYDAAIAKAEGR